MRQRNIHVHCREYEFDETLSAVDQDYRLVQVIRLGHAEGYRMFFTLDPMRLVVS